MALSQPMIVRFPLRLVVKRSVRAQRPSLWVGLLLLLSLGVALPPGAQATGAPHADACEALTAQGDTLQARLHRALNRAPLQTTRLPVHERLGFDLAGNAVSRRDCLQPGSAAYARTFWTEGRGLFVAGALEQSIRLADALEQDTLLTTGPAVSAVYEFAGRAAHALGRSPEALYWFRLAIRHDAELSVDERVELRRRLANYGNMVASYDVAESALTEAFALAETHSLDAVPAPRRADLHNLMASNQIWRLLQGAGGSVQVGRRHVERARHYARLGDSKWAAVESITADAYACMLRSIQNNWTVDRSAFEAVLHRAQANHSPLVVAFLLGNFGRMELKSGHPHEALRHAKRALLIAREKGYRSNLSFLLRLKIDAAVALDDRAVAMSALEALQDLDASSASEHLQKASLLVSRQFADEAASPLPWPLPWMLVALLTAGGAALWVRTRSGSHSAPEDATPEDAAPEDAAPRDAAPGDAMPTGVSLAAARPEPHTRARSDARSSGQRGRWGRTGTSGQERRRTAQTGPGSGRPGHLDVYALSGHFLGEVPIPCPLRPSDKGARTRLVGVDTGACILVVEMAATASPRFVQRTDGGGFDVQHLERSIHGVVVAEIHWSLAG